MLVSVIQLNYIIYQWFCDKFKFTNSNAGRRKPKDFIFGKLHSTVYNYKHYLFIDMTSKQDKCTLNEVIKLMGEI